MRRRREPSSQFVTTEAPAVIALARQNAHTEQEASTFLAMLNLDPGKQYHAITCELDCVGLHCECLCHGSVA